MIQSVQALCIVTLDVPAAISSDMLPTAIEHAFETGSFKRIEPTACEVRAVREEAAIFDNNQDQWEAGTRQLRKAGRPTFVVSLLDGDSIPKGELCNAVVAAMTANIAEALNFMAGAAIPAAWVHALEWATGMAEEAIVEREGGDDPEDTPDIIAMHRGELEKARALLKGLAFAKRAEETEEMARILDGVLGVINMTNPRHEDFRDSGADAIDALTDWEADIRKVLGYGPAAGEPGSAE